MNANLKNLQEEHEKLIVKAEEDPLPEDLLPQVDAFIQKVQKAGASVRDSLERDLLRSFLRYWGSYVYKHKGVYPNAELEPSTELKSYPKKRWGVSPAFLLVAGALVLLVGAVASQLVLRRLFPPLSPTVVPTPFTGPVFDVYTDVGAPENHFIPSGYLGDSGDITVDEAWSDNPHSGTSSIRITYSAKGRGPHFCDYAPPCKWVSVYWLNPADNWGTVPNVGFNLTGFHKLTFWARTDTPSMVIKFLVGGLGLEVRTLAPYPDSLRPPRDSGWVIVTNDWQPFEIDLTGADLSYVIGGFAWVTNWDVNMIRADSPKTLVLYLDDIRFEAKR